MSVVLPIDEQIPRITALLKPGVNLVIEASPGAGKTTRAPPALLRGMGEVVVLEPRRIAARMAARRVAEELGEPVGATVGYQVRFEDNTTPKTRLKFATEGVLTRRLLINPELRGVSTVILDEFHERHLETDLALALLRNLQKTRRQDLSIVVMSATLDAGPVASFLGNCEVIRSEGREYELLIEHMPYSAAAMERQVTDAVERSAWRCGNSTRRTGTGTPCHETSPAARTSVRRSPACRTGHRGAPSPSPAFGRWWIPVWRESPAILPGRGCRRSMSGGSAGLRRGSGRDAPGEPGAAA